MTENTLWNGRISSRTIIKLLFLFPLLPVTLPIWLLLWATTHYTITTKRVRTSMGIFGKTVKNVPLEQVASVEERKGLLGRILGYGTIIVETTGGKPIKMVDVTDSTFVTGKIEELQRWYSKKRVEEIKTGEM